MALTDVFEANDDKKPKKDGSRKPPPVKKPEPKKSVPGAAIARRPPDGMANRPPQGMGQRGQDDPMQGGMPGMFGGPPPPGAVPPEMIQRLQRLAQQDRERGVQRTPQDIMRAMQDAGGGPEGGFPGEEHGQPQFKQPAAKPKKAGAPVLDPMSPDFDIDSIMKVED